MCTVGRISRSARSWISTNIVQVIPDEIWRINSPHCHLLMSAAYQTQLTLKRNTPTLVLITHFRRLCAISRKVPCISTLEIAIIQFSVQLPARVPWNPWWILPQIFSRDFQRLPILATVDFVESGMLHHLEAPGCRKIALTGLGWILPHLQTSYIWTFRYASTWAVCKGRKATEKAVAKLNSSVLRLLGVILPEPHTRWTKGPRNLANSVFRYPTSTPAYPPIPSSLANFSVGRCW